MGTTLIILCEGIKTFMVNATSDSFSLADRIISLPSSIGDCESLTEVCCFYHTLPIPASYAFTELY